MANDNTQEQPTIPAIFITKSEGNYLMQLLVSANQGAMGLANEDQPRQRYSAGLEVSERDGKHHLLVLD
jgi:hypothetical protein